MFKWLKSAKNAWKPSVIAWSSCIYTFSWMFWASLNWSKDKSDSLEKLILHYMKIVFHFGLYSTCIVFIYDALYLEYAALPDSIRVSKQVKVGPSDLHVLDTADIRPGHHLSSGNHTKADRWVERYSSCDHTSSSPGDITRCFGVWICTDYFVVFFEHLQLHLLIFCLYIHYSVQLNLTCPQYKTVMMLY